MPGGFPRPWRLKQGNGLTRVESRLLWQLCSCHSVGWEFCSPNSVWQHPAENYILALSGRVLNLPRCPGINLTWTEGSADVWTQQNTLNEMAASPRVSVESSLRDPRGPLTLARQEGHSPCGWPQPPCEGPGSCESCLCGGSPSASGLDKARWKEHLLLCGGIRWKPRRSARQKGPEQCKSAAFAPQWHKRG